MRIKGRKRNLLTFEFRLYNYYIIEEEELIVGIESEL